MLPIAMPSEDALACLTGLYHGDKLPFPRGQLVIILEKALVVPLLPGHHVEQIASDRVLDELEGRGWIDLNNEPPSITPRGRYWLRRYSDKVLGKGVEPYICLPGTGKDNAPSAELPHQHGV